MEMPLKSGTTRSARKVWSASQASLDPPTQTAMSGARPFLGLSVRLHRRVIVQVIAAQIRERRRVEPHPVHAALIERVRGDLHRDRTGALGAKLREHAVHADRIGRGMGRRFERIEAAPADGADVGRSVTEARQALRREISAGGLAVGAGNAHDAHMRRGPLVEAVGDTAHEPAQTRDRRREQRLGKTRSLDPRTRLPQNRACAARRGLGGEFEAVGPPALERQEQAAGTYRAAVDREIGNLHVVGRYHGDSIEQPHE
jgi:hypothetical protein